MLSKYILPGDRIELTAKTRQKMGKDGDIEKKVYTSTVGDIISEDRLEIVMPMEKTKLVLLPIDGEYEICFYTKTGVFVCEARVVERYKSEGLYLLLFELTSNLRKNQRREFYRYNCVINMHVRELNEEESSGLQRGVYELVDGLPLQPSVIVDISGGGIRFVSQHKYEQDVYIYFTYTLIFGGIEKKYELIGKILKVKEVENKRGLYEHRVQYVNIKNQEREEIIRYIFEEERKSRQKK